MNARPAPTRSSGESLPRGRGREESLATFLADRARRTSDGALATTAAVGLLGSVGTVVWGGAGWTLACAVSLCLVAFGFWGISDRELTERLSDPGRHGLKALRLARALAGAIGATAGLAAIFSATALALGTWIS